MTPFSSVHSLVVPLLRDNVDTDAVIPSREIRSVSKQGLAGGLFADWRYLDTDRTPNPDFVLNQPLYAGASILASGANFGCGSSREQAAWALLEYGFRVIVAPSFNPIFRRNCIRNGILPVTLDATPIAQATGPVEVDLAARSIRAAGGQTWSFEIEDQVATMLLGGLDEIELTLTRRETIAAFRAQDRLGRAWAYRDVSAAG
jgi:3-isopropylmalate/(R)-2-methylmalate dehydratase small subunit